jgi:hypothetical protein
MSLARAFTTRIGKRENTSTPPPIRTGSVRNAVKAIDRSIISPPVALLSTTNMLSYNAPDISSLNKTLRKASSISSSSSKASADDSDGSSTGDRSRDTYNTDTSSVEGSPSTSPDGKDAKSYFQSDTRQSVPRRSISTSDLRTRSAAESPEIPQRAPSHSKRAHEQLARKRSLQQFPSSHSSVHSTSSATAREQRSSADMFSAAKLDSVHPFGRELEQLDEIAEEFNGTVRDVDREADLAAMKNNLAKWCADDYIQEIKPLFSIYFQPQVVAGGGGGGWI